MEIWRKFIGKLKLWNGLIIRTSFDCIRYNNDVEFIKFQFTQEYADENIISHPKCFIYYYQKKKVMETKNMLYIVSEYASQGEIFGNIQYNTIQYKKLFDICLIKYAEKFNWLKSILQTILHDMAKWANVGHAKNSGKFYLPLSIVINVGLFIVILRYLFLFFVLFSVFLFSFFS